VEELGIGFVVGDLEEVGAIAADRDAIAEATRNCLAVRDRFTTEHNAARIREFAEPLL
jgi:hypothetical protein